MATAQVTREAEIYLGVFGGLEKKRDRAPEWLSALRRSAMERFAETGFPTTAEEEWRFTNVAPIAQTAFEPAVGGQVAASTLTALGVPPAGATRLVLVDGRFDPALRARAAAATGFMRCLWPRSSARSRSGCASTWAGSRAARGIRSRR